MHPLGNRLDKIDVFLDCLGHEGRDLRLGEHPGDIDPEGRPEGLDQPGPVITTDPFHGFSNQGNGNTTDGRRLCDISHCVPNLIDSGSVGEAGLEVSEKRV